MFHQLEALDTNVFCLLFQALKGKRVCCSTTWIQALAALGDETHNWFLLKITA